MATQLNWGYESRFLKQTKRLVRGKPTDRRAPICLAPCLMCNGACTSASELITKKTKWACASAGKLTNPNRCPSLWDLLLQLLLG